MRLSACWLAFAALTWSGCILQPENTACWTARFCDACIAQSGCGWCDGRCVPGSSLGADAVSCEGWSFASCEDAAPPTPPPGPCDVSTCGECLRGSGCTWCALAAFGDDGGGYCTDDAWCFEGGQAFTESCPSTFGCGSYGTDCDACARDPSCEYCWEYRISDTFSTERCSDFDSCPGCADGSSRACGYCTWR